MTRRKDIRKRAPAQALVEDIIERDAVEHIPQPVDLIAPVVAEAADPGFDRPGSPAGPFGAASRC